MEGALFMERVAWSLGLLFVWFCVALDTCAQTMAAELLAAGADPNVVEKDYLQTPLHLCATHGHANIAKLMLDKGADPHARDAWGNSFTDIATAVSTRLVLKDPAAPRRVGV